MDYRSSLFDTLKSVASSEEELADINTLEKAISKAPKNVLQQIAYGTDPIVERIAFTDIPSYVVMAVVIAEIGDRDRFRTQLEHGCVLSLIILTAIIVATWFFLSWLFT